MEEPSHHKIIVGVDYGTTYTGISFVSTDKHDINDIVVVNSWPGPSRDTETVFKTPSRIAYASENISRSDLWGFQVEPGMTAYSWTKLLLDKNTPKAQHDDAALKSTAGMGMLQLPAGKAAVDVCADFLRSVYRYMLQTLEKQITREILKVTPLEFWFTMPAIWSDQAQSATRKAAEQAGFGSRPGDKIYMITEPEAAGIATLKRNTVDESRSVAKGYTQPGDGILICDCGGGTVDITTYKIKEVRPKLEFSEICTGTGAKCGSTAIDRNFYMLLSKRFGHAFDSLPLKKKGPGSNLMKAFEQVKRDFGYCREEQIHELPLNMSIEKVDPDHFDNDERLVLLSYQDIRELFDPVVDRIFKLVGEQINEANKKEKKWVVNKIILVGGFGDSEYLRQAMEKSFAKLGKIQVIVPDQPQAAIVRGAALRGLEGVRPKTKRCRRHYGFSVLLPFRPGVDSEAHATYDLYDGRKLAAGGMSWIIEKGDEILEGEWRANSLQRTHVSSDATSSTMTLFSCSLDDAPERFDDLGVETVGEVQVDFSNMDIASTFKSRRDWKYGRIYRLDFEVKVLFGAQAGILQFQSESRGRVIGKTSIKFAGN